MPIVPLESSDRGSQPPTTDREINSLPPVRKRVRSAPAPSASNAPGDHAAGASSYAVGYCRPPTHTRFKKGQSGNPKGRPKQAKNFNTMVREVLTQKIMVRTADGETKVPRIYALFLKRVDLALKGDARAAAEIFKLYGAAVPDVVSAEPGGGENELTRTDLEILEELKTLFGQDAI